MTSRTAAVVVLAVLAIALVGALVILVPWGTTASMTGSVTPDATVDFSSAEIAVGDRLARLLIVPGLISTGMSQSASALEACVVRNGANGSLSVIWMVCSSGASKPAITAVQPFAFWDCALKASHVARMSLAVIWRPLSGALSWYITFGFRLKT